MLVFGAQQVVIGVDWFVDVVLVFASGIFCGVIGVWMFLIGVGILVFGMV